MTLMSAIKVQLKKSEQRWHGYVSGIKQSRLVWSHSLGTSKYILFSDYLYCIPPYIFLLLSLKFFALMNVTSFKRYHGLLGAASAREAGRLEEVFDQFGQRTCQRLTIDYSHSEQAIIFLKEIPPFAHIPSSFATSRIQEGESGVEETLHRHSPPAEEESTKGSGSSTRSGTAPESRDVSRRRGAQ